MKVLQCSKCGRNQSQGKFCLDCGSKLNEIITTEIKFKPIKSGRTSDQLKRDIRNWLGRLGIQQSDIIINSSGGESQVEYSLKNVVYKFSSHLQDSITNNLAAVEQFLHHRVLGIERGIESREQAFAGYEALPDLTNDDNFDPYLALGFKEHVDLEVAKDKFKQLAKRFHPDVNDSPEASRQFQSIKKAIDMIEKK